MKEERSITSATQLTDAGGGGAGGFDATSKRLHWRVAVLYIRQPAGACPVTLAPVESLTRRLGCACSGRSPGLRSLPPASAPARPARCRRNIIDKNRCGLLILFCRAQQIGGGLAAMLALRRSRSPAVFAGRSPSVGPAPLRRPARPGRPAPAAPPRARRVPPRCAPPRRACPTGSGSGHPASGVPVPRLSTPGEAPRGAVGRYQREGRRGVEGVVDAVSP